MTRIDEIERQLRRFFIQEETDDIIAWLKGNVMNIPYSPMPGGFRTLETPWLEEILRAMADPEVKMVSLKAPIQSGKSLALELLLLWIICRQPGPSLFLQDKDANARDWYEDRLIKLIENCPPALARMNRKDSRWQSSEFDRMRLWTLGSDTVKNLQRRSIRWLVMDETWLWKPGHLNEAMSRVSAFGWLGKIIMASQGSYEGDETAEFHLQTDQREWTFSCDSCGTRQPFSWSQIRFPENYKVGDAYDYRLIAKETTYECVCCKRIWKDSPGSRAMMNASGQFVPMNGNAEKGKVGFHYNALAVRSWGTLAAKLVRAKESATLYGDEEPRRIWKQKEMAEPWSDEPESLDKPISASEYRLGDPWDQEGGFVDGLLVPPDKIEEARKMPGFRWLRFLNVDVQRTGFYLIARAWAIDGRSRLLFRNFVQSWDQIEQIRSSLKIDPQAVMVDSGDQTGDVYDQCSRFGFYCSKGSATNEFPWVKQTPGGSKTFYRPISRPRKIQVNGRTTKLYLFSNLVLKDNLFRLRKAGLHTYPIDAGDDYERQMTSEIRTRSSSTKRPEWRILGSRANHYWDCEVMGLIIPTLLRVIGREARKPDQERIDSQGNDEEGSDQQDEG